MQIPNYGWVVILLLVAGVAFAAGGYSTQALTKPAPVVERQVPVYVTVYPTAPPVQYSAPVATQAQKTTQTLSGNGNDVRHVQLKKGLLEATETHTENTNMIVRISDSNGNHFGLLANSIRPGSSTMALTIPSAGEYTIEIEHPGAWTLKLVN